MGLSVLSRGSPEEKLRWIFRLYDTDGDGWLNRGDVFRVVASIYDLMGNNTLPPISPETIDDHVDYLMQALL